MCTCHRTFDKVSQGRIEGICCTSEDRLGLDVFGIWLHLSYALVFVDRGSVLVLHVYRHEKEI